MNFVVFFLNSQFQNKKKLSRNFILLIFFHKIKKDKLFYFVNGEFTDRIETVTFAPGSSTSNFKLDEILRELRYFKKSKVFILYSLKSEQYKLLVAP